jgi:ABC-type uncharacterized transport system ATPase subunit
MTRPVALWPSWSRDQPYHALIVVGDMQFVRMIARTVTVMHQGGAGGRHDGPDPQEQRRRDIYLGKHGGA